MKLLKDLYLRLLATDEEKIRDRKERIQHPHHIKSKSHWDWDSGYYNIDDKDEGSKNDN
jgi:hypothetical protein